MDNDPRSLFERRYQVLEDLDAVFVCPVMEYGSEVIYIRTDCLLGEEVTEKFSLENTLECVDSLRLECNSLFQFRGQSGSSFCCCIWQVLDNALHTWKLLGNADRNKTMRPSDINKGVDVFPGVAVNQKVRWFVDLGEELSESFCTGRVFGEDLVHTLVCVVGKRPALLVSELLVQGGFWDMDLRLHCFLQNSAISPTHQLPNPSVSTHTLQIFETKDETYHNPSRPKFIQLHN
jgi:hypothetical protein